MKSKAILMALAMMTTALAGCTSGTDGVPEVDEDALNELIQDNLQDFINNTTVVVNQDFHYHNNTTVVNNQYDSTNQYNNTTTVEGGDVVNNYEDNDYTNTSYSVEGGGGSSSGGQVYYIDFVFTLADLWGHNDDVEEVDHMNNSVVYDNYTYYDYINNQTVSGDFTIQCSVYYIVGSGSNNNSGGILSYWENNNWYDQAWDDMGYNTTMRELFQQAAWDTDVRLACDEGYDPNAGSWSSYYEEVFFTFTIPEGMVLHCAQEVGYTNPILWHRYTGSNGSWDIYSTQHPVIDGMQGGCTYSLGGAYDMTVEISNNNLRYWHEYRITWAYTLIPGLPSPSE